MKCPQEKKQQVQDQIKTVEGNTAIQAQEKVKNMVLDLTKNWQLEPPTAEDMKQNAAENAKMDAAMAQVAKMEQES